MEDTISIIWRWHKYLHGKYKTFNKQLEPVREFSMDDGNQNHV